jgi:hypothetical protein
MRRFVAFVLVLVAALVVVALLAVPAFVRPLVVNQVRAALPFQGQPVDVQVELNPIGLLLGTIDSIHVTGTGLETATATIGSLDLTFHDVSTSSHAFESVDGSLKQVTLPFVQDTELVVDTITVSGSSSDIHAVADLDIRASLALIGNAFGDAGVAVDGLELTKGGVTFNLFGQPVTVQAGVDSGSLVLLDVAGGGPMTIVQPAPDDPWRITGVSVTPSGVRIEASIGTAGLLQPE